MFPSVPPGRVGRRLLLASAGLTLVSGCSSEPLPRLPEPIAYAGPPVQAIPGGWRFFTAEEGAAVEALADCLIPPDPVTPGGRESGVAVYIDRQLAGPYGSSDGLYMRPPFADGTPQQGMQSPLTPAVRYRRALAALDEACRRGFAGKAFRAIPPDQQIVLLQRLEAGNLVLAGSNGRAFFEMLLHNAREGFFADPVYGGNVGMVGWKMIGFPGARYDHRDWVGRHGERYTLPPVAIGGVPA